MASSAILCFLLALTRLTDLCVGEYLDLSHNMDNRSLYWPSGQNGFQLETLHHGYTNGHWLQTDQMYSGIHLATHMDAPLHFFEKGWSIDEIPVERFIAPAVMVDIREVASQDPDSYLTLENIQKWETNYGRIPDKSVVLMCSGWSSKYPDKEATFGNDEENTSDFHFPGFHVDGIRWLIDNRDIVGIATEAPSFDNGQLSTFDVHILTSSHNIWGMEYVKDVCKLPPSGATLYAFPAKYKRSSGAPTRVVAIWDTTPGEGHVNTGKILLVLVNLLVGYAIGNGLI